VVVGSARDYARAHPATAVLVVEVSDATLAFDRATKGALYAQAGITEYWIVNLADRVLEVHREPAPMAEQPLGHHYRSITRHTETEHVAPQAATLATPIAVADLLP
jgi:Uma2 family endonuclease